MRNPKELVEQGASLGQQGRSAEAEELFRAALAIEPDYAAAHSNLGNALQALGHLDEAIVSYRRALELMPDSPGIHANLGVALRAQHKLDAAATAFQRAIELAPDSVMLHGVLGSVLEGLGRFTEASACYQRVLELRPNDADAQIQFRRLLELGRLLDSAGQTNSAIDTYRTVISKMPDFAEAYYNLGIALQRDPDTLDEAIANYRTAIKLKPDFAAAHYNLAWSLLRKGELAEGWREYEWRWRFAELNSSQEGAISAAAVVGRAGRRPNHVDLARTRIRRRDPVRPVSSGRAEPGVARRPGRAQAAQAPVREQPRRCRDRRR